MRNRSPALFTAVSDGGKNKERRNVRKIIAALLLDVTERTASNSIVRLRYIEVHGCVQLNYKRYRGNNVYNWIKDFLFADVSDA